jgi:two-component system, LuxR family, sensor kinase FixL
MAGDKKAADTHFAESDARLRAILDTAVEGIIIIDTHGIVQLFNRAAERIFGYTADEVVGRSVNQLMPQPDRSSHDHYLQNYVRTGKGKIIGIGRDVRGQRNDGSTFPMSLAVSEVGGGSRRQFVGIVRDISESKRLEEALVMASENERQIIGQELHDALGQQLTAIALMSRALEKKAGHAEPAVRDAAASVAEMARDAVNAAKRLAHGLFPTELERNGLAAALEGLVDNQRSLFNMECSYNGLRGRRLGMPRPVDRNLYRIAQEAVSNAIKHSGAKLIAVNLEVTPAELVLTVTDDGRGLPARQEPGKGMGLAIMKYRAGMINASLTISSGPRNGTIVECRLPDWQKAVEQRKPT